MKKFVAMAAVFALFSALPSTAGATISSVFNLQYSGTTPTNSVPCTVQTGANAGIRFCTGSGATAPRSIVWSFDKTPIDVNVAFPPDPGGSDNNYPMVMLFHGWGGTKLGLSSMTRWTSQGYAAMSITDRGWGASCGSASVRATEDALLPGACTASGVSKGYIRLMDDRYEVRDAQTLVGLLVDEGLVNPSQIAATGGSYGGGMSVAARRPQQPHDAPRRLDGPLDQPDKQHAAPHRRGRPRVPLDRPAAGADARTAATSTTPRTTPTRGPARLRPTAPRGGSAPRSRTGRRASSSPGSCWATTRRPARTRRPTCRAGTRSPTTAAPMTPASMPPRPPLR